MSRLITRYVVVLATLLVLATTLVLFYTGPLMVIRKTRRESAEYVDVNLSTLRTSHQRTKVAKVLLVSEPDSGAALAGDVINLSPGIYYIFEPLKRLRSLMQASYEEHSKSGTLAQHLDKFYSDSAALLDSMLTCGFSRTDLTLLDPTSLGHNPQSATLARCLESAAKTKSAHQPLHDSVQMNNLFAELSSCVQELETQCYKHTTLLKVTGLRGGDLQRLLLRHHDLAVVYLVRDPRGSVWSRMNNDPKEKNVSSLAHTLCSVIEDGLSSVVELRQRYPGRIAVLKYENLAKRPVQTSKLLYSFLRLDWAYGTAEQILPLVQQFLGKTIAQLHYTSEVKVTKLQGHLHADVDPDTRRRLLRSAHAWRQNMPWAHVKKIQSNCFNFMRQLGYELFRYEGDVRGIRTPQADPPVQQDVLIDADVLLDSFAETQELDH